MRDLQMIRRGGKLVVVGKAKRSLKLLRRWAILATAIHVMWEL